MDDAVAVCLYSKYSQRCKEFMDDVTSDMGIQMLCIDNKQVRKTIMDDKNGYHIKTVPCVFLFFSNGRLEKYEGSDAFVWLRKIMEQREGDLEAPPPPPSRSTHTKMRMETVPEDDEEEEQQESRLVQTEIMDTETNEIRPQQTTEQILENEMNMRRASDQVLTRKNDSIKELAQMLQRQRESDEERMNPPPPGAAPSKFV